ncbi:MAG: ATP-binding cassette domain-containing protein [Acetobacteraceae bacterium]|nr:ATP-binding cassette domain-containing protein [Acetobacteraceae bacterium]
MLDALVEAERVSKRFDQPASPVRFGLPLRPKPRFHAVADVSFRIGRGTTFSLVGESGCGKTTLARMAVGLLRPCAGAITFEKRNVAESGRAAKGRMNMVFQNPHASLNPSWRVRDIIGEPLLAFGLTPTRKAAAERVAELLDQVGLSFRDGARYPHEFSGGQRQRISIARALSSNPAFLACDEPTSALDVSVQAQVLNLLRDLQDRLGLTYLFISHNLAVVRHMSDVLAVMYCGRIVETGPSEDVFRAPLHPYTRLLLDTVPDLSRIGRPHGVLRGEPPSPMAPPSGCAFHPRCPLANERCRSERPAETTVGAIRVACHAVAEGRAGG